MSEREIENIKKLVENIEHEKKKNRILLSIFVVAVIGFFILLYNHPHMDHQDVLESVSFPPTPKDLQRLATVWLKRYRSSWSIKKNILRTRLWYSYICTRYCKPSQSRDPYFCVYWHHLSSEQSEHTSSSSLYLCIYLVLQLGCQYLLLPELFSG